MRGEPLALALLLSLCAVTAQAEPPETQDPAAEETELPSMDFLEFLGEWETEDGGWVDPLELETWTPPEVPDEEKKDEDDNDES